jgi:hypothetical protein
MERREQWRARVSGQASEAFTPYSIDETFALDQLVLHRKFGAGYVANVLPEGKLSVMFESGPRTLVHGGK